MSFVSTLKKNNENAILSATDVEGFINHTRGEQKKAKEKIETMKMIMETLKKKTESLKKKIEDIKITHLEQEQAHEVEKAKVQKLDTHLEHAQAKQREIEQLKNPVPRGIKFSTQPLPPLAYAEFFTSGGRHLKKRTN
ncbi:hypothetical protein KY290_002251 [Solanum tuberosum]|nr:hypothetical protein KY284_002305 [Solanum tuberosum]KAH0731223.1 hypothetical protein KY289_002411 [Solanum tuberosum]KAH0782653.1 hypothetical protein KY290_002251 [Solanum tuberosum]